MSSEVVLDPAVRKGINPRSDACFSLANRVARCCWGICYLLFFRFSPRPLHRWRVLVLKCFGAKLGNNCHVYPKVSIWAPWNLSMHDDACMADGVNCYSMGKIEIGEKAVISQGVHLCTGTHDYNDPNFQLITRPIRIKAQAWVCTESFIGPGVTIEQGAVIGARSVVNNNMPAWMVCVGNPCKPLKKRELSQ